MWLENAQGAGDRVALSKALGALEQAMGSENSSEAIVLFGRALLMASNNDSAERMLQDATTKEPVDPQAFYFLADASERLGHFQAARARRCSNYQALRGEEADARRRLTMELRLGDLSVKLNEPATASATSLAPRRSRRQTPPSSRDSPTRSGDRATRMPPAPPCCVLSNGSRPIGPCWP